LAVTVLQAELAVLELPAALVEELVVAAGHSVVALALDWGLEL